MGCRQFAKAGFRGQTPGCWNGIFVRIINIMELWGVPACHAAVFPAVMKPVGAMARLFGAAPPLAWRPGLAERVAAAHG
jgi:hypothetical protein